MADKKISGLTAAGTLTGTELVEVVQGGVNKQSTTQDIADLAGSGVTREFNRAWSSELLFDKNEIDYAQHTQTDDINFTVASVGHLEDQFITAVQTIVADGVNTISFSGFHFIYGLQSGAVPDAGTYQVFFMYRNGVASAHWAEPSFEEANLSTLATPASFAFVPDGANGDEELDGTWGAVTNASGYELQYSVSGGAGPWIPLAMPSGTSYSHTGLAAGTTYHYRIRAIGDGSTYANSNWTVTAATTEDAGDVTAPVATFDPADSETGVPINGVVTITFNEAIRNADGSETTNANVAALLTIKEDNISGSDIAFTATINSGKTIITISPAAGADNIWGSTQDVFIQVDGIEDVNGNESAAQDATFTTSDYTLNVGNALSFGDILDSLWTANDTNFEFEVEAQLIVLIGTRTIVSKWVLSHGFQWFYIDTDCYFEYTGNSGNLRQIKWTGAMTTGAHKLKLKYDGAIDTNNGLDRVVLEIDDVVVGSKTLNLSPGSLPTVIPNNTAVLRVGPTYAEVRDFFVRSNNGATTEISVPVFRTGEDVSGNNRDGTWG